MRKILCKKSKCVEITYIFYRVLLCVSFTKYNGGITYADAQFFSKTNGWQDLYDSSDCESYEEFIESVKKLVEVVW